MKVTLLLLGLYSLASAAPTRGPAAPPASPALVRTLRQAFDLALKNTEAIGVDEQAIRRAEALYRQALGAPGPELSARSDTSWQQARTSSIQGTQENAALTLSRSGLTGYRELAAIRSQKALVGQRGFELRRAEQLVLAGVAGAYYGLLQAHENGASLKRLISQADKRLVELRDRVRVGRSREADVTSQDYQANTLQSQLEESLRQATARADLLAYLTRAPLSGEGLAEGPPLPQERTIDAYLARVDARPEVLAAAAVRERSQADRDAARALHLPEFNFEANYYPVRPASTANNRWDATVGIGLPLWSWGARTATVDAATAVLAQAELSLQAARRAAELDVRNAFRDYVSAKRQLELLSHALETARKDYGYQMRDEKRGLVTALEVLASLDRLTSAELTYTNARLTARLAALNLEIASATPFDSMDTLK